MRNQKGCFGKLANVLVKGFIASMLLVCIAQYASAAPITIISINRDSGELAWLVNGTPWFAKVEKDPYFSDSIPIISIDVETGNETLLENFDNCFYRGRLTDSTGVDIPNSQAFVNFCSPDPVFTGFVSDANNVYRIEEDPQNPGSLVMLVDDPSVPLTTPNETNVGNNGGNGSGQLLQPNTQVVRNGGAQIFPSLEINVEPAFISTYPSPGYIYRIASTLAFTNFIYAQNGMKQYTLVSINLLSAPLNANGGQGNIRHQLRNFRQSTVQPTSGDISILMVGGDVDTTYLWGWTIDEVACSLQIAVTEGQDIHSFDVGQSSLFVIDLPSLIQRGWIMAHELGHATGAKKHINGDPLMDGWFQEIPVLSQYVAGCAAKTQIFHSCAYDAKSKKVIDFYTCP